MQNNLKNSKTCLTQANKWRVRDKNSDKITYKTVKKLTMKNKSEFLCNCDYFKRKNKYCKHIWHIIMRTAKWTYK